jgi:hypothetical protein
MPYNLQGVHKSPTLSSALLPQALFFSHVINCNRTKTGGAALHTYILHISLPLLLHAKTTFCKEYPYYTGEKRNIEDKKIIRGLFCPLLHMEYEVQYKKKSAVHRKYRNSITVAYGIVREQLRTA